MHRSVRFDPGAGAAAAAAALVADEFATFPMAGSDDAGVILVGAESRVRGRRDRRIIGVVPAAATTPWPDTWYALVPEGAARALVARAVHNAFADLEAASERERLERELGELNAIGIRLTAERDSDRVLETILQKAREITRSDAGSLYLVEDGSNGTRRLRFALAQNDSIAVPFEQTTLPLDRSSVAGYVALTGECLNLADAYVPPPAGEFDINRSYDARTGYRTKSMLVVPMKTPKGDIIGVVQLINCKPSTGLRLRTPQEFEHLVTEFSPRFEQLASSLASQAAVALLNRRLYEDIRGLFEGFVRASVTTIESRDPTTAGHSFRVADLTLGLAHAVNRTTSGPLAEVRIDGDGLRELRYAALLHDFGKVAVRERVLGKAKKLHPEELERIRHRIDVVRRELELRAANDKLAFVLGRGAAAYAAHASAVDTELAAALGALDDCADRLLRVNEPSVVAQEASAEIDAIARRTFRDRSGTPRSVLTAEESEILRITRGTLTPEEYEEIRDHVVHTWQFLVLIPWTEELRQVPAIARDHHEKLDGSGYPRGIAGDAIAVQSRMMTIADIYDALTAFDRPYKPALAPEAALEILEHERRAGRLDGPLLDLFVDAKVYEITRERTHGHAGGDLPLPGIDVVY